MTNSKAIITSRLRKALAQFPHLARALDLLWAVARPWTIAWVLLLLIQGLLPAAAVYLLKVIVDGLVMTLKTGTPGSNLRVVFFPVVALGVVMLIMEVARSCTNWVRTIQVELLRDHITSLIHVKSVEADLAFYERADYYDHLHRARSEATYRPIALLENLGALLQNGVTLLAMGAILILLGPILGIALLVSTLPAFFVVVRYALEEYQWRQRTTADDRRTWYYDWLLTSPDSAAELRLFDLGGHFKSVYSSVRQGLRTERFALSRRQAVAELFASLIALSIIGFAMGWMIWRAVLGFVSLGELALVYAAFNQGQRLMRTLLENVGQLYANSLFLGNLFEFLSLQPLVKEIEPAKARHLSQVSDSINFSGVTFQYPDASSKALDGFGLTIPAGQIVAIVGPNGAGKSTLIKLLCRFYDPDEGAIEIDNVDVRELRVKDLRQLITVLFQTPFHYNTTIRENIQYGDFAAETTLDDVKKAAEAAGASEIIERLPGGYETLLGKWFSGGTELSVGEWQRVALARAFLRRAPVIILDEPTSALDPWAEADWLMRFRDLAAGRTAIIITHRFTTAMYADEIHVMKDGRIAESGTHGQLLERGGLYAESWTRQITAVERELEAAT